VDVALEILLLKVAIAPAFIGLLSLIALKYGHRAAGWLVALPVNTGSILFVLALTQGADFAAHAALGALLGIVSLSAFSIGYARSALRFSWPVCLGVAVAGFVASTAALTFAPELVAVDLAAAVVAVATVLAVLPKRTEPPLPPPSPRWEIPLRMLTAAGLVVAITTAAQDLGAQLSGLLSPVPVFTITLVIFTHSRQGPTPILVFLGGLQYGMFSFAAFCATTAVLLVPFGIGVAIGGGLVAFLGVFALLRILSGAGSGVRGTSPGPAP
jgi:hypothetical protein